MLKIDKEKKKFKEQAQQLRDAYVELLDIFHKCKHYTAMKSIEEAVVSTNRAIKQLEEACGE